MTSPDRGCGASHPRPTFFQMRLRLVFPLALSVAAFATPSALAVFPAGQCTTWAFLMRPDIVADGALMGDGAQDWNAGQWAANAQREGFPVGTKAKVGAIAVWPANVLGAGPVGHVAYVEKVRPDGSFYVSEEDYNGSPKVHRRWVEPASAFQFIYLLPGEHVPTKPLTPGGEMTKLTSFGSYSAAGPDQTEVDLTLDKTTWVALHLVGPNVDKRLAYHLHAGTTGFNLALLSGKSSLAAGAYRLYTFAYNTNTDWRWLTFTLV